MGTAGLSADEAVEDSASTIASRTGPDIVNKGGETTYRAWSVLEAYLLQPRLDDGDRDASAILLHVIIASLLIEVSPQSCHAAL